jgi:hypothetical protein
MTPGPKLDELNRIYTEAEQADREVFAEMRSNILLISGEHFSRLSSKSDKNLRGPSQSSTETQKLRIVKNHTHKVNRHYVSTIQSYAPGVTVGPQDPNSPQDKKSAELNKKYYEYAKKKYKLKRHFRRACQDFIGVGEAAYLITYDHNGGEFTGQYEPQLGEEGEPLLDEMGQPLFDTARPIFTGGFVFKRVYGFNLLRAPSVESMEDDDGAFIVRDMVDTEELKANYRDNPDIVNKITESKEKTFVVFDANKGDYQKVKGQTVTRLYLWRPCRKYPEGYFSFGTDSVVLEEGPLPGGVFPLVFKAFDEHQTSPRGRSIIKVARPYQAEISRASSAMALAQVTTGDDKVLYQAGTKLSQGALLPGVRGIAYQGAAPTILPGRTGSQYLDYVNSQISELYSVVMMQEELEENSGNGIDPYTLLYRAASQHKKYGPYIEKFEEFLIDFAETLFSLARYYVADEELIQVFGASETNNIAEFRNTSPLCYSLAVEAQNDTLESKFGRQLTFQTLLQYVGKDLDKKTLGKLIKNLPYANYEDSFSDLTVDADNIENDILALERGQVPQVNPYGDLDYTVQALTARMKRQDYAFLDPAIQANYEAYKQQHVALIAEREKALLEAKNEYIPVDGPMAACDLYVPDPNDPTKAAKRAKIPQRALEWLLEKLESQGASLEKLEQMNQSVLADVATQLLGPEEPGPPMQ